MARLMSKMMSGGGDNQADPIARPGDRELEVFRLLDPSRTTREIAEQLSLETTTVDTYLTGIKEKLKLPNSARLRFEASRWVQQHE
jgi:DNA-binding NarL/FixJ family response regulator